MTIDQQNNRLEQPAIDNQDTLFDLPVTVVATELETIGPITEVSPPASEALNPPLAPTPPEAGAPEQPDGHKRLWLVGGAVTGLAAVVAAGIFGLGDRGTKSGQPEAKASVSPAASALPSVSPSSPAAVSSAPETQATRPPFPEVTLSSIKLIPRDAPPAAVIADFQGNYNNLIMSGDQQLITQTIGMVIYQVGQTNLEAAIRGDAKIWSDNRSHNGPGPLTFAFTLLNHPKVYTNANGQLQFDAHLGYSETSLDTNNNPIQVMGGDNLNYSFIYSSEVLSADGTGQGGWLVTATKPVQ